MHTTESVVRETLHRVAGVATLPTVALRIMRIADDPSATEDTLHEALISDPALAARVLKVVNSAFYRRQREVGSPRAAIRLLGIDAIRNVALAASLHRLFRGRRGIVGFDPAAVWEHSIAVGVAARVLAARTGVLAAEEAMVAGLLHDVGLIVAMQAWMPEFSQIVQRAGAPDAPSFLELERELLHATHEDFGRALCEAWHFPATFALMCGHHHDFRELPDSQQPPAALMHVADALAARLGAGYSATVRPDAPFAEALGMLHLTESDLSAVSEVVALEVPSAVAMLAA